MGNVLKRCGPELTIKHLGLLFFVLFYLFVLFFGFVFVFVVKYLNVVNLTNVQNKFIFKDA